MKDIVRIFIIGIFPILIAGCSLFEEKQEELATVEKKEGKEDKS